MNEIDRAKRKPTLRFVSVVIGVIPAALVANKLDLLAALKGLTLIFFFFIWGAAAFFFMATLPLLMSSSGDAEKETASSPGDQEAPLDDDNERKNERE